jgi:hypothetical protein
MWNIPSSAHPHTFLENLLGFATTPMLAMVAYTS